MDKAKKIVEKKSSGDAGFDATIQMFFPKKSKKSISDMLSDTLPVDPSIFDVVRMENQTKRVTKVPVVWDIKPPVNQSISKPQKS